MEKKAPGTNAKPARSDSELNGAKLIAILGCLLVGFTSQEMAATLDSEDEDEFEFEDDYA